MYSLRDHLSEFLQVYADGTLKEEKVQNNLKIKQIMVATIKDRGGKKDALMIYRYFKNPEFEFIYKQGRRGAVTGLETVTNVL